MWRAPCSYTAKSPSGNISPQTNQTAQIFCHSCPPLGKLQSSGGIQRKGRSNSCWRRWVVRRKLANSVKHSVFTGVSNSRKYCTIIYGFTRFTIFWGALERQREKYPLENKLNITAAYPEVDRSGKKDLSGLISLRRDIPWRWFSCVATTWCSPHYALTRTTGTMPQCAQLATMCVINILYVHGSIAITS